MKWVRPLLRLLLGAFCVYLGVAMLRIANGADAGAGASNPGAAAGEGVGLLFFSVLAAAFLLQGSWGVLTGAWRLRRVYQEHQQDGLSEP